MTNLPYHCPTLNGNFFKPPCERQIAEAKEKRAKFPHMLLGFLEKCLECGGKDLMQREGAMSVVKPGPLSLENRQAMIQDAPIPSSDVRTLPEKTGNYDKNYDKAVEVIQKGDSAESVIQKDEMAESVWKIGDTSKSKPFNNGYIEQGPLKVTIKIYPRTEKKCVSCNVPIPPGIPCGLSSAYSWTFCQDCIESKGGVECSTVPHDDADQSNVEQIVLGAIAGAQEQGEDIDRMALSEKLGIKPYKIDLIVNSLWNHGKIERVPGSWPHAFVVKQVGLLVDPSNDLSASINPGPMIISETTNEVAKINTPAECEKEAQNIPEIFQPAPNTHTRLVNIGKGEVAEILDSKDSLHTVDSSTCEILQTDSLDASKNERGNRTETRTTQEDQSMVAVVKFKSREEAEKYLGPGKIPEHEEPSSHKIPTCTRPDCEAPGSPIKIDKLGRSMGMCAACVSARGRRGGFALLRAAKTSTPVIAALDGEKYVDLKAWLEAQADENERTLLQEIIYRLKTAMRVSVSNA